MGGLAVWKWWAAVEEAGQTLGALAKARQLALAVIVTGCAL